MASRLILPFADVGPGITKFDGAQLYFYDTGTSNLATTWADQAKTTPNDNPVISGANGVFADIWIDGSYKVVLDGSDDVQIWEADPVISTGASTILSDNNTWTGTNTFSAAVTVNAKMVVSDDTSTYAFNNVVSGLAATQHATAINEVNAKVNTNTSDIAAITPLETLISTTVPIAASTLDIALDTGTYKDFRLEVRAVDPNGTLGLQLGHSAGSIYNAALYDASVIGAKSISANINGQTQAHITNNKASTGEVAATINLIDYSNNGTYYAFNVFSTYIFSGSGVAIQTNAIYDSDPTALNTIDSIRLISSGTFTAAGSIKLYGTAI